MKTRSILIGLSSLLGLSLCSGIFGAAYSNKAMETNAASSTAVYTIASATSVTASGDVPEGSSATFKNTYTSNKEQITSGKSMTLTLAGYKGYVIKGISLLMKSNKNQGAGSFSAKVGAETLASLGSTTFDKWYNSGSYSGVYKDINVTMANPKYVIKENENLVITISASVNSLYCQNFKITYEKDAEPIYASGVTITSDFDGKTIYDTTDVVTITSSLTPTDYNGDISYEFADSSMSEFASIKKNDDLTCSLTPLKPGTVSIIAKANSGETETISSNVLTLEIAKDMPKALEVSGQKTDYVDGDTFDFGDNFKAVLTYGSGAKKEIDSSKLTVELDNNEVNESTVITENDNGKEVTIEYLGITYAYKIVVTSALKYIQVTDINSLNPGDIIAIVSKDKQVYSGNTINDSYLEVKDATFGSDGSLIANSFHFILDKNGDYWNLVAEDGYLSATAVKKLEISNSLSSAISANWTINIDKDGNATIANSNSKYGRILHNVINTRFTTYTSETNATMLLPQIYKLSNYAYTNGVKSFVNAIDELVTCDPNGEQSDFDLWDDIKTDYYQSLGNFDKISLKNFASNPSGDEIETALSKYDYIVDKYDNLDDYLGRRSGDSSKAQLVNKIKDDNSATTITCLLLLGCSSLVATGLFAIRKKRHSN